MPSFGLFFRRVALLVLGLPLLAAPAAHAGFKLDRGEKHTLLVLLDARIGLSSDEASHRSRGVGLLRLGGKDTDGDGLGEEKRFTGYLGQLGLQLNGRLGPYTQYHLEVNSQMDGHERTAANIPEWFLQHEGRWNKATLKLRGGFLIPPISMEHPGRAWSTFFTLTPSAIGSWVGEEVRAYGFEGRYSARLAQKKRVTATVGTFQGGDTAGQLLSWRGWAMHDRQAGLGDRTRFRGNIFLTSPQFFGFTNAYARPFLEMDERWGVYTAFQLDTTRARFTHTYWNNRADRTAAEQSKLFGWNTHFQSLGGRYEPVDRRFLLQAQVVWGNDRMGGGAPARVDNDFDAWYVLLSKPTPLARVTARYDDFTVKEGGLYRSFDHNGQDGHALTLAVVKSLNDSTDLVGEVVSLKSERPGNALLGTGTTLRETQWQLAWRYYH